MMYACRLALMSVPGCWCIGLSGHLTLSPDVSIREVNTGEFYRYLGFFESEGLDCSGSKQILLEEYKRRLSLVWKSYLSGPCKVRATNSFCIPILTYGFLSYSMDKAGNFPD